MPIGIIINLAAVAGGGLAGAALGGRLPGKLNENLTMIFGLASMGMGISAIVLMENMPAVINDFKACGGFIMLATGFRIIGLKMFPTADMIPAMILVMPLSALWSRYILPLTGG